MELGAGNIKTFLGLEREQNAVIESVQLTTADHGCLSGWLHLKYGGGEGQCFGGQVLYWPNKGENFTGFFISRCLEIAGVSEWSKLAGRPIRVRSESGLIKAIGHFIEDDWFCPSTDLK